MAQRQTPDRPDEQQHQGEGVDNPLPQQRQVGEGQQSGDQNGSETEQPGMEAQPEAATECTAGTDCKKE